MPDNTVKIAAVGDVQPHRDNPDDLFVLVKEHLEWADVRVCQLEATLSEKGTVRTDVRNPTHRVPPENVKALTSANFDVATFAGNNNLDFGLEAFSDTIELLEHHGIKVVGAGNNVDEARSPVLLKVGNTTLAFLNFCSILRDGYRATEKRAGVSPLQVATYYEPLENIYEQPGTPARTITIPDHADMQAALDFIRQARDMADVVIVSFHWGVHFTHDLAMYQPDVAYAAIDAGADLIIGTHPHCLQAVDVYKGKYILYSLGNFAFEQPVPAARKGVKEYLSFYSLPTDPELPEHPHPAHCRKTVVAKITLKGNGVERLSLVPVFFNGERQPEPLSPGSVLHGEIASLMDSLCSEIGVRTVVDGDELVVLPTKTQDIDAREWVRERSLSYPWLNRLSMDS